MQTHPSFRTAPTLSIAVLSVLLLSLPSSASAQSSRPEGVRGPGGGSMAAGPQKSRRANQLMRLYDTDGDGKITIGDINNDQSRMFTAMDIDGDKNLSVDEMKRRGRSLQIFQTTTIFDLLDANGDGKLSVAEIQAPSQRWFKRYDANANGALEASEIPDRRRHSRRGQSRRR